MALTAEQKAKLANITLGENKVIKNEIAQMDPGAAASTVSRVRSEFQRKFGATDEQVEHLLAQIGHVESGNKNLFQGRKLESQGPVEGKPGRGFFQFETETGGGSGAFQTALNRYENMQKDTWESPGWFKGARKSDNALLLTRSQQEDILLADLYMKEGSDPLIKKALKTGNVKDLWLQKHWAGATVGSQEYKDKSDWSSTVNSAFDKIKSLDDIFGGAFG